MISFDTARQDRISWREKQTELYQVVFDDHSDNVISTMLPTGVVLHCVVTTGGGPAYPPVGVVLRQGGDTGQITGQFQMIESSRVTGHR
jgi:hypothetical protein